MEQSGMWTQGKQHQENEKKFSIMVSCCRIVNMKCSKGGKEVRDEGTNILYLFYQLFIILRL